MEVSFDSLPFLVIVISVHSSYTVYIDSYYSGTLSIYGYDGLGAAYFTTITIDSVCHHF